MLPVKSNDNPLGLVRGKATAMQGDNPNSITERGREQSKRRGRHLRSSDPRFDLICFKETEFCTILGRQSDAISVFLLEVFHPMMYWKGDETYMYKGSRVSGIYFEALSNLRARIGFLLIPSGRFVLVWEGSAQQCAVPHSIIET